METHFVPFFFSKYEYLSSLIHPKKTLYSPTERQDGPLLTFPFTLLLHNPPINYATPAKFLQRIAIFANEIMIVGQSSPEAAADGSA
ncbi:hypothetical protein CEXT_214971 [Caerostris extrusa]|uniref:Uncharacterized protein n=1 Tax=Caerostris extrusa TaxID=172846 RepID=A0AAV4M5G6_CAEEX|nr:hypothetical protein CEXT_214971 [Caerostris extrusa]